MKLSWLASSLAVALLLSGCAADETDDGLPQGGDGPSQVDLDLAACGLGNATACAAIAPHVDARTLLDNLQQFSSAHPYRSTGSPTMAAARDDLAARLASAGLDVVRQDFAGGGQNILGFKWGLDREHWIVIGAHYDVTEGAVYGTYDDGSGTAFVFELASAFQAINTTRTIVFAEFDQEEMGLVGSQAFIEAVVDGTFVHAGTLDGMIDIDMFGITYPHPAHAIVWENSPTLTQRILDIAQATGVPQEVFVFRASPVGSSDGAAFISAGIATAYFFSDWDEYYLPAGIQYPADPIAYAGTYPWWHKADTYETMLVSAGDEATLVAGFQTGLDIVSPLLLSMTTPGFVPDPE
ncbi:MAG: M28 family peptidase [Candidatus Thermoplasmatota archaeon]